MEAENEHRYRIQGEHEEGSCCLQVFQLYQTQSMFYMIGRNKNRSLWRVLKIDRLEPTELNIHEDFTSYSEVECHDLLRMIHEGNKATGGLKFVTDCYGIVGFIKFLGPYYMLLITERQKIGAICGHTIYSITKSEMMPLSSSYVQFNMNYSRIENRYKKLFCTVDLTKDFFFSYSYHVMRSLQRNLCDNDAEQVLYETMFVWNAFLTRGIRNNLNNTLWTVALVYGFFKQTKLSVGRKDFKLTLIARRSRHYAGTRYLKRGVNENGRVANDVEIEQLVFEDVSNGHPSQISSVVQHRGSIPLFWSQETSRLNMKPDIKLQKKDVNYEATRLHFENLVKRYGKPIIILNLIKTREKNPRESLLRTEFANAIDFINKDLSEENRLKFIHWDLHRLSRSKATNVLNLLGKVAAYVLNLTGFLYCQVTPDLELDGVFDSKFFQRNDTNGLYPENDDINDAKVMDVLQNGGKAEVYYLVKPRMVQEGVLRTNCIDCLDRTNVAQYAYGLAALGRQLHTLGLIDVPKVDLDSPLADNLMIFYEIMGDTLALQYGGSAAHNKIFSARRGQWKAATQSQEFFRTLQRYYSNSYMDAEKQEAINVFLGNFQPQHDKLALWETDKNKCENFSEHYKAHGDDLTRDFVKRSLSDGNILRGSNTPVSIGSIEQGVHPKSALTERGIVVNKGLSDSAPDISTSKNDVFYSSYNPSSVCRKLFSDRWDESNHIYFSHDGRGDALNCSNVLDLDCLTSFENSCQDKMWEKSLHGDSPAATFMPNFFGNGISMKSTAPVCENGSNVKMAGNADIELLYDELQNAEILNGYSDRFVHWINYGETLCR